MNRPTPAQDFAAAMLLIRAASWGALIWGVISWWRDTVDLNDLGPSDD